MVLNQWSGDSWGSWTAWDAWKLSMKSRAVVSVFECVIQGSAPSQKNILGEYFGRAQDSKTENNCYSENALRRCFPGEQLLMKPLVSGFDYYFQFVRRCQSLLNLSWWGKRTATLSPFLPFQAGNSPSPHFSVYFRWTAWSSYPKCQNRWLCSAVQHTCVDSRILLLTFFLYKAEFHELFGGFLRSI